MQASGRRKSFFEGFVISAVAKIAPRLLSMQDWMRYLQSQNPNVRLAALKALCKDLEKIRNLNNLRDRRLLESLSFLVPLLMDPNSKAAQYATLIVVNVLDEMNRKSIPFERFPALSESFNSGLLYRLIVSVQEPQADSDLNKLRFKLFKIIMDMKPEYMRAFLDQASILNYVRFLIGAREKGLAFKILAQHAFNNPAMQDAAREAQLIGQVIEGIGDRFCKKSAFLALEALAKDNPANQDFIREQGGLEKILSYVNPLVHVFEEMREDREDLEAVLTDRLDWEDFDERYINYGSRIMTMAYIVENNFLNQVKAYEGLEREHLLTRLVKCLIFEQNRLNQVPYGENPARFALLSLCKNNVYITEKIVNIFKTSAITEDKKLKFVKEIGWGRRDLLVLSRASKKVRDNVRIIQEDYINKNDIEGLRSWLSTGYNAQVSIAVKRVLETASLSEEVKRILSQVVTPFRASQGSSGAAAASSNVASAGP
ncbi:MAG: hypothetical protein K0R66_915 [Gammaproteobacteria bacterium]|jgi:hypothetical protein|nr:hypothetical protein [Gammaproteobacteria bacterium]